MDGQMLRRGFGIVWINPEIVLNSERRPPSPRLGLPPLISHGFGMEASCLLFQDVGRELGCGARQEKRGNARLWPITRLLGEPLVIEGGPIRLLEPNGASARRL